MRSPSRFIHSVALMAPALVMVGLLFVYPLVFSLAFAFRNEQTGGWDLGNFNKAFSLYSGDIALTAGVTVLSTALVGVIAIAVAGYITLGENPRAVALLRWIYRWPLFIPFVVAAQLMRTFLAKNGMLNNALMSLGVVDPMHAISLLDWRGVVITFVWKQLPFAALATFTIIPTSAVSRLKSPNSAAFSAALDNFSKKQSPERVRLVNLYGSERDQ